jgi:hypothetical protein
MTYTDENGNVYNVLGEISMPPKTEIVPCIRFSFTSVTKTENGNWILKLAPGVAGCTYYLYSFEDLSDISQDPATLVPMATTNLLEDGEFTFEVDSQNTHRFWKVLGEDGIKEL